MAIELMSSAEEVLHEASVALRPIDDVQLNAIFRALLTMTDHGVLVTDLEHHPLACNSKFGELFHADPHDVPFMEVEELRKYVYPRLSDPEAWRKQLEDVYATPEETHEDELELIDDEQVVLRRKTSPLIDAEGQIIGRLWRFEDVTEEKRRAKRRALTNQVSTFHSTDPDEVMQFVVDAVGTCFEAISILSIWNGDELLFRKVANMPAEGADMRSNTWDNSYCRETISTKAPFRVQDARVDERFCNISPALAGMTRYTGVPIFDMAGSAIGTLCFLDHRSWAPVSDDEVEFMSILAQRLSTELERERLYEERTAAQRTTLERQDLELAATQDVLSAMNRAFEMLADTTDFSVLAAQQASLIEGLLGYESAAIVVLDHPKAEAYVSRNGESANFNLSEDEFRALSREVENASRPISVFKGESRSFDRISGGEWATIARLPIDIGAPCALVLGGSQSFLGDRRHDAHLTAIIDQIALLFASHSLNQQLRSANDELSATQNRLIESEKLSVVGALAASVAHDIRNIMASVSLECATPGDDPLDTLHRVKAHVDRFAVLSHRLLSYAKPKQVARDRIDLNELIERASAMLATQIRVTKVDLTLKFDENMPSVVADPHRVEHLLVNLMLNALQAMKTTGGQLRVWTICDDAGGLVVVEDNGRGIKPEDVRKLFEPFFSTRDDGFGLGLFSCRQIAIEHGWDLNVRSEVGVGSRFTISIPKEKLKP